LTPKAPYKFRPEPQELARRLERGFHGSPYGTSLLATIDAQAYASGYTDGKAASSRAETPGTVTP